MLPQWLRVLICEWSEHDTRKPDKEHTWAWCGRCGATLSPIFGEAPKADDGERDA